MDISVYSLSNLIFKIDGNKTLSELNKECVEYLISISVDNLLFIVTDTNISLINKELKKNKYSDYLSKEIILPLIKKFGYLLEYVSNELKCDIDIIFLAIKQNEYAIQHINNINTLLFIINNYNYNYNYIADEFKNNNEIIKAIQLKETI